MTGAASWSFSESDFKQIQTQLQAFLREANARCALLVDRTGQLVATVGETPAFDPMAFASLTAADFSANDQLAKMIGEAEFASLVHQGEKESMFLADVAKRLILVVLFDQRTTLGLVKLKGKTAVEQLNKIFAAMFNRVGAGPAAPAKGLLEGAEDEIDKLFG
jgi:predicted regulator of Ras-like GTPase activity (Roadblock/LC7/MglB family)